MNTRSPCGSAPLGRQFRARPTRQVNALRASATREQLIAIDQSIDDVMVVDDMAMLAAKCSCVHRAGGATRSATC